MKTPSFCWNPLKPELSDLLPRTSTPNIAANSSLSYPLRFNGTGAHDIPRSLNTHRELLVAKRGTISCVYPRVGENAVLYMYMAPRRFVLLRLFSRLRGRRKGKERESRELCYSNHHNPLIGKNMHSKSFIMIYHHNLNLVKIKCQLKRTSPRPIRRSSGCPQKRL